MSDVTRIDEAKCLECGKRLDAIGGLGRTSEPPSAGDAVVCIRCGAVMTYEAGALRGFTAAEMDAIEADPEWIEDIAQQVARIHFLRHGVK